MLEEIKRYFQNGNAITRLILVNIGVFVVQSIILLAFTLIGKQGNFLAAMDYLYFPATFFEWLRHPWSVLTYQFLHEPLGLFHILFNMLYLFWFGRILLDFLQEKYIVPLYITGGIAGAVLFMLIYNFSPAFQTHALLLGASASVLAIVVAAATLVPDYTIHLILIGAVRLKWIALIAVLVDVVAISSGGNAGGHIAHLGGALTGFLFIRSYRVGIHWFDGLIAWKDYLISWLKGEPRMVFVRNEKPPSKPSKPVFDKDHQEQMDAILDKISVSGYDSLSAKEKAFLFKASQDK